MGSGTGTYGRSWLEDAAGDVKKLWMQNWSLCKRLSYELAGTGYWSIVEQAEVSNNWAAEVQIWEMEPSS